MSIILKKGQPRQFVCFRCGRSFERIVFPNQLKRRRFKRPFCSQECLFVNGHSGIKKVERVKKSCDHCGRKMEVGPWTIRRGRGKFCSADCRIKSVTMERTLGSDGYYIVTRDGKRLREHRVVMEEKIGRKLEPGEDVHHINFDKLDNRPGNLHLCSKKEHGTIHADLEKVLHELMRVGAVRWDGRGYVLASTLGT